MGGEAALLGAIGVDFEAGEIADLGGGDVLEHGDLFRPPIVIRILFLSRQNG